MITNYLSADYFLLGVVGADKTELLQSKCAYKQHTKQVVQIYCVEFSGAVAGMGPCPPIVETRRKVVHAVGNCQSCRRRGGGGKFKMLSSGKIFGLSEKFSGLSEKYCPCPPRKKHGSHGATG